MRFKSDAQRRAVFSKINKFSFPSESVLSTAPKYVFDEKPVDQFSAKSDYEGIIRGLRNIEDNPKYAAELREKARVERERAEGIAKDKFVGDDLKVLPNSEFVDVVTNDDIDSYMRKYNLKSVPDVALVAEDKAADAARFKGVIHYETAPDSYEDYQKYLLEETKRMDGDNSAKKALALKSQEDVVVYPVSTVKKSEPVDYDHTDYVSPSERFESRRRENERAMELYGKTMDEIDYEFGDNNVIWTAEQGATSRGEYLNILRDAMKSSDRYKNKKR